MAPPPWAAARCAVGHKTGYGRGLTVLERVSLQPLVLEHSVTPYTATQCHLGHSLRLHPPPVQTRMPVTSTQCSVHSGGALAEARTAIGRDRVTAHSSLDTAPPACARRTATMNSIRLEL